MRKMATWTAAAVLFSVLGAGAVACGGDDDNASFYDGKGAPSNGGSSSGTSGGTSGGTGLGIPSGATSGGTSGATSGGTSGASTPTKPEDPSAPPTTPGNVQSGVLTAGVWDDNLNFDFYKKYVGLSAGLASIPAFTLTEREQARAQWTSRGAKTELDVAFVLDTTGSMGDELAYIQKEIDGIASSIKSKHPQMAARYSLIVYRDKGDIYQTRTFDFGALEDLKKNLVLQSVGGGGDYPEGVADGLDATVKLGWRTGSVARMAFWVADAPHHAGEQDAVKASILAAAAKDVHLYPVSASGSDDLTEFTMRTAAQMTGGRYIFLTDDSGVGGGHAEPKIPCYHVTRFDGALVRMVESELTGQHTQPGATEILRSVGNPKDGQCTTTSSGNVTVY